MLVHLIKLLIGELKQLILIVISTYLISLYSLQHFQVMNLFLLSHIFEFSLYLLELIQVFLHSRKNIILDIFFLYNSVSQIVFLNFSLKLVKDFDFMLLHDLDLLFSDIQIIQNRLDLIFLLEQLLLQISLLLQLILLLLVLFTQFVDSILNLTYGTLSIFHRLHCLIVLLFCYLNLLEGLLSFLVYLLLLFNLCQSDDTSL